MKAEQTSNLRCADIAIEESHRDGKSLASYHQPHPRDFGGTIVEMVNGPRWIIENPASRENYWRQLYFWALYVYQRSPVETPGNDIQHDHAEKACVEIFEDYDESEVMRDHPPSVQRAWKAGRAISQCEKYSPVEPTEEIYTQEAINTANARTRERLATLKVDDDSPMKATDSPYDLALRGKRREPNK